MTSVPHLDCERSTSWNLAQRQAFSARNQRKIRHVQAILVRNLKLPANVSGKDPRLLRLKTKSTVNMANGASTQNNKVKTLSRVGDLIQLSRNEEFSSQDKVQLGSDPVERQLEIQAINKRMFLECFFTVNHFLDTKTPFYISRVFSDSVHICDDIQLSSLSLKSFTINLYAKIDTDWKLLVRYNVKLSFLVNLGSDYEVIESKLRNEPNLLLLKLNDDCYYVQSSTYLPREVIKDLKTYHLNKSARSYLHEEPTCTFDQIMKLNNLTVCLVDLLSSKKVLTDKIESLLRNSCPPKSNPVAINCLKTLIDNQKLSNKLLKQQIYRLTDIQRAKQCETRHALLKEYKREDYAHYSLDLESISSQISKEKSRIANTLLTIFPITISDSLEFSLFGYRLPQSLNYLKMTRIEMEKTNALLGIVVFLVIKLSNYLDVPLRYPLKFLGSNSYITDPVSKMQTKLRVYPLFVVQNSNLAIRFEFGLSLLLKNLQQVFESENLSKLDDHDLLANLKVLLTCIATDDGLELNDYLVTKDKVNTIKLNLLKK
ncbi:hypothetical protein KL928_001703 [Ogataea angusta]|uniref:Uncharacterized protein n=1 Tax=Pichia angusta TaxID=870730 RepID=A0AAN6I6P0_PICAN|nr:uncharacterized protein KL928_001703 [Ogataea angusta]KAG7820266.1 hypothetical protein KL928_001703 [Ogataea angusta]